MQWNMDLQADAVPRASIAWVPHSRGNLACGSSVSITRAVVSTPRDYKRVTTWSTPCDPGATAKEVV